MKLPSVNKGFALLEILIVLGIVATIAGGGWYVKNLGEQQVAVQQGNNALDAAKKLQQTLNEQADNQQKVIDKIETAANSTSSKWKTYRNEQYGFEFRYPEEFSLKINEHGSVFLSYKIDGKNNDDQIGTLEISARGNISYQLKDYCSYHEQVYFCRTEPVPNTDASYSDSNKEVSLNGYDAIYFTLLGIGEDSMYLVKSPNGQVWSLRIYDTTYGSDLNLYSEFKSKLNQILSTFKFFEPIPSGWKTYRNERYGFEFQYPSEWLISKKDILEGNRVLIAQPSDYLKSREDSFYKGFLGVDRLNSNSGSIDNGSANPDELPMNKWFTSYYEYDFLATAVQSSSSRKIDGYQAIFIKPNEGIGTVYYTYVFKNKEVFSIFYAGNTKEQDQIGSAFLSSFKFIKP